MEVSGESLGHLFGPSVLPDSGALGARLPGLPGSCPIKLLPPSRLGRAATAAAPVHHTLRQPWVLTVSSAPDSERRSPLGHYPCSVSIFGLVSFYPGG